MKNLLSFLLLLLPLLGWAQADAPPQRVVGDNAFNNTTYTARPPLRVGSAQGVSAPFAGRVAGSVWVAGGCNFPDVPAAEGGKKKMYADVYALTPAEGNGANWHKVGQLPRPLAYGVGLSVPEGLVCIGGTDGQSSRAEAYLLSADGAAGFRCTSLPSLPVALDNMAGAFGGGYLYVAAGQSNGQGSQAVFRLAWPDGQTWERLPDLPGPSRLQPVAAVQQTGTGPRFYLLGGFTPATATQRGLRLRPRQG